MRVLQHVQRLFSLDTLDTRFTTSSKALLPNEHLLRKIPRADSHDGSYNLHPRQIGRTIEEAGPSASKWSSPEFMVYAVVFMIAIPLMFKTAYDVSARMCILSLARCCGGF